ncbi:MAG: hypothetical protein ACJAQ6_001700 [Arenicella sp.]|jgi:hypothetical protein
MLVVELVIVTRLTYRPEVPARTYRDYVILTSYRPTLIALSFFAKHSTLIFSEP